MLSNTARSYVSWLRQHLIKQKSVAAIVKDETYETLRAIIVSEKLALWRWAGGWIRRATQ